MGKTSDETKDQKAAETIQPSTEDEKKKEYEEQLKVFQNELSQDIISFEEKSSGFFVCTTKHGKKYIVSEYLECSQQFDDRYEETEFGFVLHNKNGLMCFCTKDMEHSIWFNGGWKIENKKVIYWNKLQEEVFITLI